MKDIRPESEGELAEIVRGAAAERRPLEILGGGTRPMGHEVAGDRLRVGGLRGIALYEPGALTLVAGAGTPLAEIDAALAAEGQRLPFEPWDARRLMGTAGEPTIGGAVAVNASGPRRLQAGACRDSLIGVRFVGGAGQVVKSGGRVMKNVTGLDLVKLMAGSHGTLGVLTEVAFKVLPAPELALTLAWLGLTDAAAVALMTAATATPFEVTGAAHRSEGPVTLLRLEGFAASVAYRAGELVRRLERYGKPRRIEGPGDWASVRDLRAFAGRPGDVWRISVKPTDGPKVAAVLRGLGPVDLVLDWAGGLVSALVPEETDVRALLRAVPGHATILRADAATKARLGVFHPQPEAVARLSEGLRARLDPHGILNPGRMTGGITGRATGGMTGRARARAEA